MTDAAPPDAGSDAGASFAQVMDTAAVSAANGGSAPFHPVAAEARDSAFPAAFGLAVISGLADEVQVFSTESGLSVRMSWPAVPAK